MVPLNGSTANSCVSLSSQFYITCKLPQVLSAPSSRSLMKMLNSIIPVHPFIPMDLCMSGLSKCSLTCSCFTKGKSFLLQTFALVSGAWDCWEPVLPVRTEVKKSLSTLSFFMSFVTRTLASFSSGPMFFLVLLHCWSTHGVLSKWPSPPLPDSTPGCLLFS